MGEEIIERRVFWLKASALELLDRLVASQRQDNKTDSTGHKNKVAINLPYFLVDDYVLLRRYLDTSFLNRYYEDVKECMLDEPSVELKKFATYVSRNKYTEAAKTKLYDHIIGVAKEVLRYPCSEEDRRVALYYALLHDVGKSPCIRKKYSLAEERGHEYASAQYAKILLSDTRYTNLLKGLVEYLESCSTAKPKKNYYARILEECDVNARSKEGIGK